MRPDSLFVRRRRGFSLIQMMVALAISSILLAGVIQIYISTKQASRTNDAAAQVQETARFADEFLTSELRQSAYLGCDATTYDPEMTVDVSASSLGGNTALNIAITGDGSASNDPSAGVEGYEISGSLNSGHVLKDVGLSVSTSTPHNNEDIVDGTEVVMVRGADPCPGISGQVTNFNRSGNNVTLNDANACDIDQNDIVLVSDCEKAEIFSNSNQITAAGSQTLNAGGNRNQGSSPRLNNYDDINNMSVMKFDAAVYYVGHDGDGGRSLFKRHLVAGSFFTNELVPGVRDIAFEYGEDTNEDVSVDQWRSTPGNINDSENVVALRYEVLATSAKQNVTEGQSVNFDGGSVSPPDGELMRTFTNTIAIRNRRIQ